MLVEFVIDVGGHRLVYSDLASLEKVLADELKLDIEFGERYNRVEVVVDKTLNSFNYVAIVLDFNYAFGYSVEGVAPCHDIKEIYKLYKTGLKKIWWFIAGSVLKSLPLEIGDLYEVLWELLEYKDCGKTVKLKPIFTWDYMEELNEYYPDTLEKQGGYCRSLPSTLLTCLLSL